MVSKKQTLAELVKSGIGGAKEDDQYYYLSDSTRGGFYDQSFYRYNKDTGELEWFPSFLDFIPVLEKAEPVSDLSIFESLI